MTSTLKDLQKDLQKAGLSVVGVGEEGVCRLRNLPVPRPGVERT